MKEIPLEDILEKMNRIVAEPTPDLNEVVVGLCLAIFWLAKGQPREIVQLAVEISNAALRPLKEDAKLPTRRSA